jgi:phosphoribosylformimino-5-aminoimidazole carboxamide ribotide isomerase
MVHGVGGEVFTSNDPVEMAKLWRKENAKSLHVTDLDAEEEHFPNIGIIGKMVSAVDIPIEFGGIVNTAETLDTVFAAGMYRAAIGYRMIAETETAKRVIQKFGTSKIVLGIVARGGIVHDSAKNISSGTTASELALKAKAFGIKRVMYTDILRPPLPRTANIEAVSDLAKATGMRITVSGGINGLDDLLKLQELEPLGIDSVVIGNAFYENKFACQGIWRLCEAGDYPYTAKV